MTKDSSVKLRSASVRRVRRITAGLQHHRAPSWSPDGRRLISACGSGADSAWIVSDRKGRVACVLEGPVEGAAAIAPDQTVAYGRQVGATSEIWILPSGGAEPRRLLGADGRLYRDPAFSPDGRLLCYAADDGTGKSGALKLWLLDLAQDQRSELLSDERAGRPAEPGGDTRLTSLGHPTWSPSGERLFFEAMTADGPALYLLELASRAATRLTGPGYRRPSAISDTLLCAERALEDGGSEIVLLELRPGRLPGGLRVREAALTERADCARDPAVCAGATKKKIGALLCWAEPGKKSDGEPQRYDLHVGELVGLPLRSLPPPGERVPETEPQPAGEEPERGESAAQATGLQAMTATGPGLDPSTDERRGLSAVPSRYFSRAFDERPLPGGLHAEPHSAAAERGGARGR
ncbi:MAG: hypothetical protein U1A78_36215 [Polyangia bacterium]